MDIVIPTKGRVDKQKTFKALPDSLKEKVVFICVPEEYDSLVERYSKFGAKVMICDVPGIAAARQYAVEHLGPCIVFLDDDLRFSRREKDWNPDQYRTYIPPATSEDIWEGIMWLANINAEEPMRGLSARGGNQGQKARWTKRCGRCMRSWSVWAPFLLEHNIRFDKYQFFEDFHVPLSVLKLGYAGTINVDILSDGIANDNGGCSSYRTPEILAAVGAEFVKEHGDFAKLVKKSPKTWGLGEITDFIIQWEKALDYGLGVRNGAM